MTRRTCLMVVLLSLAGCRRQMPLADLGLLTEMVGCTLPADALLLGGRRSETGAYWFVRSAHALNLTSDQSPAGTQPAESAIPEGVLTGLLKQHDCLNEVPSPEKIPGRLREWERADGLLRIRDFLTSAGWYSVIEFSPTPAS